MTQISGDAWTVAGFNAGKYIASIRNTPRKEYARTYLTDILNGRKERCPDAGTLSTMAAQAVRMRLDDIFHECPS